MNFPEKLDNKLSERGATNSLRKLTNQNNLIDFSSNDYLGFSKSKEIFEKAHQYLAENNLQQNGATGSRLLSGNHELHEQVEQQLTSFFNSEAALLFNSGYDANVGLFSSVPQRGDVILYDEYIHASIRDGIRLSNAKAYSFKHNDLADLEQQILRQAQNDSLRHTELVEVYVATESVFSMDGDSPDLIALSKLCKKHKAHLIVDEAHAVGVLGKNGCGFVSELNLEKVVFATIVTFGKAMGCHGAAILGSEKLKEYLINFARSFIYTTALPPHALATIKMAFDELVIMNDMNLPAVGRESQQEKLQVNIQYFNQQQSTNNNQLNFIKSNSAIHCCIIPGNENVKSIANQLQEKGFDVKPILSPTVAKGQERLRICLHTYNSKQEIDEVLKLLTTFVTTSP
ncbi:MAG: pyridoxal phosphate-dependent aminotransferase family protein [Urechidicola sp.]|nr:pyridoxal phosphate-dependent aminotransferase family protein [Urechidicola sp.]